MRQPSTSLNDSNAGIIVDSLKHISGGTVLDIATGDGDFISMLKKTLRDFDSFIGIDVSGKEIDAAKKSMGEAAEFFEMNAENIEFEDGCFDTVCMANSLHHLDDVGLVLGEMKRVLKHGGRFILQEMFRDGGQTEAQRSDILSHNLDADIDSVLGVPHRRTFTRDEIMDFVAKLGLRKSDVFESSRYPKCLFCDDWVRCEDPRNDAIVSFAIEEIDESLQRLSDQDRTRFQEEADRVKERIRERGSASASILFIIGKK